MMRAVCPWIWTTVRVVCQTQCQLRRFPLHSSCSKFSVQFYFIFFFFYDNQNRGDEDKSFTSFKDIFSRSPASSSDSPAASTPGSSFAKSPDKPVRPPSGSRPSGSGLSSLSRGEKIILKLPYYSFLSLSITCTINLY